MNIFQDCGTLRIQLGCQGSYNDFDHSEQSDGKVTTGSYRVVLPDGRTQVVTYKADSQNDPGLHRHSGI